MKDSSYVIYLKKENKISKNSPMRLIRMREFADQQYKEKLEDLQQRI